MSKQYTVKSGETLRSIAAKIYGDATLWPIISRANLSRIKSSDPEAVAAGAIITLPDLPEEAQRRTGFATASLADKAIDELTILIEGIAISPVSARIIRTMDTGADGWVASFPWTPGANPGFDRITRPYLFNPAAAYIGGELLVNGLLYNVSPGVGNTGRVKNLEGFSFTADAVDSTLKPPYERNNITLQQLADELVEPLGIKAVFNDDAGGAFNRVSANPSDTIFKFLATLATQRGLLVSSTPGGDLLFTKAAGGASVGTLEEGVSLVQNWGARFDGRKRFNAYRAIGQSPGSNAKAANAIDAAVPRTRFQTFTANDTITGDIQAAADWRRSKNLVEALTIPLTVTGWIAPNGEIWRENTLVTVISETLNLSTGYDLLIRSVEFVLENSGQIAILNLIPPEVYTGEDLIDPWA